MTVLGNLCELIVDCEHKTAPIQEAGYPSIRTPNIGRGFFILDNVNRVSESTYVEWTKRAVPIPGDLILAREAPVGNVAVVPEGQQFCLGQRTVLIRPDSQKIDPDYLCYLLLTPQMRGMLLGKSGGATVHHLNMRDIRSLPIAPLPNLADQRRTSSIIKAYDDLIATNQRRIQLLEDAARRLYREWFVHLRFPGHELVKVVDGVPKGWKSGAAFDFVSIQSGGTPKTGMEHYWGGEIPFFTPKDSPEAFYVTGTEKTLTESGVASCNSRLFQKETIFITARGTVGKLALAQKPMAMNQSCYALVPKQKIDNLFLFLAIKDAVDHVKQVATGGVFSAIVVDTFKVIPFVLPATPLTEDFGIVVRPFFDQIEILIMQNSELKKARDLLLPKLMSGQLDVSGIALPEEATA